MRNGLGRESGSRCCTLVVSEDKQIIDAGGRRWISVLEQVGYVQACMETCDEAVRWICFNHI